MLTAALAGTLNEYEQNFQMKTQQLLQTTAKNNSVMSQRGSTLMTKAFK